MCSNVLFLWLMWYRISLGCFICLTTIFASCKKETSPPALELEEVRMGSVALSLDGDYTTNLPSDASITLQFNQPVQPATAQEAIQLTLEGAPVAISLSFLQQNKQIVVYPTGGLQGGKTYQLRISPSLTSSAGVSIGSKQISFGTAAGSLHLLGISLEDGSIQTQDPLFNVPLTASFKLHFSAPISTSSLQNALKIQGSTAVSGIRVIATTDPKVMLVETTTPIKDYSKFTLTVSNQLIGLEGGTFESVTRTFYTGKDPQLKKPEISDDALLTLVQQQTFRYFWDFAHPESGMARERSTSGDIVTSGGSGFGLMAIIVGIERQFITRNEGIDRLSKILTFLEKADRFKGAYPHWLNGQTGKTQPFSVNDNGGDLVETSLLMQGLLTFRQYLRAGIPAEKALIDRIQTLWEEVEWDWYRQGNQQKLFWHWSPDKQWAMNLPISGWNESLITYVLAASSPTHSIPASVYHEGWARNGGMKNGNTYENLVLPLGPAYGGPLFFSHYSFLGIDPRELRDNYADNYYEQNRTHALIHQRYATRNPLRYAGYSDENWGLTASDNHIGYNAHSPTNDLGVISPTAALSSFPYTPVESMKALRFFYYHLGDRLWGNYGFYDAFSIHHEWVASTYLAIDQGPIIAMIENHRTGLLWNLFMSAPEVQSGMRNLGFNGPKL
jgi:hypothetical protein